MTFTVDHSASNAKKPAGRYEVIVEQVKPSFTRKNNPCLNFVLVIRNDVDNPVKGGKLFCSLYKKKQPTAADLAVDGYSAAQIQGWCKAAALKMAAILNGWKTCVRHWSVRWYRSNCPMRPERVTAATSACPGRRRPASRTASIAQRQHRVPAARYRRRSVQRSSPNSVTTTCRFKYLVEMERKRVA